jgi:glycosyltransferase involved in cell wall biosynthesis
MKISIITPTIREGWWNIMADTLSKQTLKNFEWIIVDDHKDDRSEIAVKYAEKYKLDIKYLKGKKRAVRRKYGLVNANNTAWPTAKGDLLVWLQDFIILPENTLQRLWKIHQSMPTALLAPCDNFVEVEKPDTSNAEDYWNGKTNVFGKEIYHTYRLDTLKTSGFVENTFLFEMNFCAIPRVVLSVLNGWWEFMDDGFGFDNTEIASRALAKGYKLYVITDLICSGIDHRQLFGDDVENRQNNFNDPRYAWLCDMTSIRELPLIRDEKLDDTISLNYEIPPFIEKADVNIRVSFMKTIMMWLEAYWTLQIFGVEAQDKLVAASEYLEKDIDIR